jgi:hypothetical protein
MNIFKELEEHDRVFAKQKEDYLTALGEFETKLNEAVMAKVDTSVFKKLEKKGVIRVRIAVKRFSSIALDFSITWEQVKAKYPKNEQVRVFRNYEGYHKFESECYPNRQASVAPIARAINKTLNTLLDEMSWR